MKQTRFFKQAVGLTLALGLAGCATLQAQVPSIQGSSASKLGAAVKLSGTLRLTIRWPNRTYNTNLLPDSTDRVVVSVKQGATVKANIERTRQSSETTVTTTVLLEAGSGYSINVDGYRGETKVASGAATGVNVRVGEMTRPVIVMSPLSFPSIESVQNAQGASVAKAGDQITLTGANFGNADALSLQVSLAGVAVPSGAVTREGTDSIKVVVPNDAKSGWVKIKVDGVESDSSNPLWIVNSLALPANASMLNGATMSLEPTIGWVNNTSTSSFDLEVPPAPDYSVSPSGQGSVTGNIFTANAHSTDPGNVTVNVTAGMAGLTSTMAVLVSPRINSVAIPAPTTTTINATSPGSDDLTSDPSTVDLTANVDGDAFNQGVNWTSSDTTLATVAANGRVTANNAGKAGSVTITATSKDDAAKSAQITITVTNKGAVAVEVK